jgi:uncharacterized membrane protein YkoI
MSGRTQKSARARAALVAALALLLGGTAGGVVLAQSRSQEGQEQQGQQGQQGQDKPKYRSSIQVPNDEKGEKGDEKAEKDEKAEGKEVEADKADEAGESTAEKSEATRFQSLARITPDQARAAAVARVAGTVTSVELENEDGNLVYGVSVKTAKGEADVKVDAGNGKVLHVETGDEND